MSSPRQILRTVVALAAVVAAAAALALPMTNAGAATPGAARRAPWCSNADLHVTYHATDAATSHRFGRLVLRNVSSHRCRTGGYAGLSYVGRRGHRVGAPADHEAGTVMVVVLSPGQRVRSLVSETVAEVYPSGTCRPVRVKGFRVFVPNSTRSQFVAHRTTGCRNATVHLITEKPLRRP